MHTYNTIRIGGERDIVILEEEGRGMRLLINAKTFSFFK